MSKQCSSKIGPKGRIGSVALRRGSAMLACLLATTLTLGCPLRGVLKPGDSGGNGSYKGSPIRGNGVFDPNMLDIG